MGDITIVGVGPGLAAQVTAEARRVLRRADRVYAHQIEHPIIRSLSKQGKLRNLPSAAETGKDHEPVLAQLVDQSRETDGVVYATPGDPLVDDELAPALIERARERGVATRVIRGISLLDSALDALHLSPPPPGLQIARAGVEDLDPCRPVMAILFGDARQSEDLLRHLTALYSSSRLCRIYRPLPEPGRRKLRRVPLSAAKQLLRPDLPTYLAFEPLHLEDRLQRFGTLKEIVSRLRAPGGCPWDREQTHASIKENLLEESYEALDALDSGDPAKMCEEFGDLLMQIMLHAQMAEEADEFTIADIMEGISAKLIRRHPHVFGDLTLHTAQDVVLNWEVIKRKERASDAHMLASVPRHMPALAYAQAVQKRAARVGFDWSSVDGVLAKVAEEVEELREAVTQEEKLHELGDLLFALVNLSRWLNLDAEEALRLSNQRFYQRFAYIEDACRRRGKQVGDYSLEELDRLWEQAKRAERSPAEANAGGKGEKVKRRGRLAGG